VSRQKKNETKMREEPIPFKFGGEKKGTFQIVGGGTQVGGQATEKCERKTRKTTVSPFSEIGLHTTTAGKGGNLFS